MHCRIIQNLRRPSCLFCAMMKLHGFKKKMWIFVLRRWKCVQWVAEIPMKMDGLDGLGWSSPKTVRGIASFWAVGCGFDAPESFQESLHGEWWLNDAMSQIRTFSSGESMVSYADSSENDCPSRHAMYDLVYQEAIETGMDQKHKFLGQIDSQRMKILSTLQILSPGCSLWAELPRHV